MNHPAWFWLGFVRDLAGWARVAWVIVIRKTLTRDFPAGQGMRLLLYTLLMVAADAQDGGPRDIAFTANLDGSEQRYVELLPPGFDAAQVHDVVVALHGHGADRWQFITDSRDECRGLRDVAARFGLIVASPDYRAKTSWMGPAAEKDVLQILNELRLRHQVGRVFIAGGSMGGTAALSFTALHPGQIAGVCSMNGTANLLEYDQFQDAIQSSFGGDQRKVPEEYRKRSAELWPGSFTMPVACTTGGADDVVPPDSVLRLLRQLESTGRPVLGLHRVSGGHSTTYEDTCTAMEFMLRRAGGVAAQVPGGLSAEEQRMLLDGIRRLTNQLAGLVGTPTQLGADARVFLKGIVWALRYETNLTRNDVTLLKQALTRAEQRTAALSAGRSEWPNRRGKVLRGFVSAVDGSTQPYGVIVPRNYDGTRPMRLDVVLHGSTKPVGLSELRFGARFDEGDEEGDEEGTSAPEAEFIELHPLGRVENCYRWAGETDVFEAIEAACHAYRIDRDRIVLRGMSMGASGTWHLGLKHPDRFVALGPYCGYVDTHRFSETPVPGFIRVGALPPHQELGLHMLDSVDFAANAGVVPAVAAIGDQDVFFQSHVHMGEALAREGLAMVNLIAPGTGHVIDPSTHREQLRRIGEHASRGLPHDPPDLRFVTWTLKYHRCHWLELLALGRHYERAEFRATVADDGGLDVLEVRNVARFAIHRPVSRLRIEGAGIRLPPHEAGDVLVFGQVRGTWRCEGFREKARLAGKRPGLQGPIDDAFVQPFLCVRGTGKPWFPGINAWAATSLQRFEYEWARYLRGDLVVKNDTEVTADDVRDRHLILFGDPGSNPWIAKALRGSPVAWTRRKLRLGGQVYDPHDHAPAFIGVGTLAPDRYFVINSGHTFHEPEFAAFNYLLFPRLGDWAVMKVPPVPPAWQPGSTTFPEEVVRAGFFNEAWRF